MLLCRVHMPGGKAECGTKQMTNPNGLGRPVKLIELDDSIDFP